MCVCVSCPYGSIRKEESSLLEVERVLFNMEISSCSTLKEKTSVQSVLMVCVCVSACVQCSCLATESQGQGATGFETVSGLCSRSNSLWQVHTCVCVHVLMPVLMWFKNIMCTCTCACCQLICLGTRHVYSVPVVRALCLESEVLWDKMPPETLL